MIRPCWLPRMSRPVGPAETRRSRGCWTPCRAPSRSRENRAEQRQRDEFAGCYDPSWGRHRARTLPAVGDHEYRTPGATGYFNYFGAPPATTARAGTATTSAPGTSSSSTATAQASAAAARGPSSTNGSRTTSRRTPATASALLAPPPVQRRKPARRAPSKPAVLEPALRRTAPSGCSAATTTLTSASPRRHPRERSTRRAECAQFVVGTGGTRLDALGAPLPNTQVQKTPPSASCSSGCTRAATTGSSCRSRARRSRTRARPCRLSTFRRRRRSRGADRNGRHRFCQLHVLLESAGC